MAAAKELNLETVPCEVRAFESPEDELELLLYDNVKRNKSRIQIAREGIALEEVLSLVEYLQAKSDDASGKYHFLIMIGDGDNYNGLPVRLRTRLKNKLHRAIYVELEYYKDGKGVVRQCHYYDRQYKRQDVTVTPPQLISCFFPYNRDGILNLFNHELCCDFTHIIVTDGIDIDSNQTPICGVL